MRRAGLDPEMGACGLAEYQAIQAVLTPQYKIKIVEFLHLHDLLYKGRQIQSILNHFFIKWPVWISGPDGQQVVRLLLYKEYFYVVTKMKCLLGKSYWCEKCNRGYDHKEDHVCERSQCTSCNATPACPGNPHLECQMCHRWFFGPVCLENHKKSEVVQQNGKRR